MLIKNEGMQCEPDVRSKLKIHRFDIRLCHTLTVFKSIVLVVYPVNLKLNEAIAFIYCGPIAKIEDGPRLIAS